MLTFGLLDDIALASEKGRPVDHHLATLPEVELGALAEWLLLSADRAGKLPPVSILKQQRLVQGMLDALARPGELLQLENAFSKSAFLVTQRNYQAADTAAWLKFKLSMSSTGQWTGLHGDEARAMVAAVEELEVNIHEHSGRAHDGVVAYYGRRDEFAFVVADSGRGPLASLHTNPEFDHVTDHGQALALTLEDGVSRLGAASGHGLGYRELFKGLATLNASLRFRSGNRALVIEGRSPQRAEASTFERPYLQGYLASIVCRSPQASLWH